MQGWMEQNGTSNPSKQFKTYKAEYGVTPFIYSVNLCDYGTLMFPENNVFCLAGWSEKIFDFMKLVESDKQAMFKEIENIEL